MAQEGALKQVNTFSKGLITEASPLNFPEDASLAEVNMVLQHDGTRRRRLGLDYEASAVLHSVMPNINTYSNFSTFVWENVNGNATLSVGVVQVSNRLYFYDLTKGNISDNMLNGGNFLGLPIVDKGIHVYSYTVVNGILVVSSLADVHYSVSGALSPKAITYDEDSDIFYASDISIKIRDLWGVHDTLKVDERPNTLSNEHKYNLRNQGWPVEYYCADGEGSNSGNSPGEADDPIQFTKDSAVVGAYPSNADHFNLAVIPRNNGDSTDAAFLDRYHVKKLESILTGTTTAAKGHFIIDAFDRGKSRQDSFYEDEVESVSTHKLSLPIASITTQVGLNLRVDPSALHSLQHEGVSDVHVKLAGYPGNSKYLPAYSHEVAYVPGQDDTVSLKNYQGSGATAFFISGVDAVQYAHVQIEYKTSIGNGQVPNLHLPVDREFGKVSVVASMGNRVFYSGIHSNIAGRDSKSVNYNGMVFFSKVVDNAEDLGICYQDADPTSDEISDLVDTDGGHIIITECDRILGMVPLMNSLLVIAENGVWRVWGSDSGFKATDYQVSKMSSIGAIGKNAIIEAEDGVFFWSHGGIYRVGPGETGSLVVQNLTHNSIQSFVNTLDTSVKEYATAQYDRVERRIHWMYNDLSGWDTTRYNKELILDLTLNAFYLYEFSAATSANSHRPFIVGRLASPRFVSEAYSIPVTTILGEEITTIGGDVVTVEGVARSANTDGFVDSTSKYVMFMPDGTMTFGTNVNTEFKDFVGWDGGTYYDSYLLTGEDTASSFANKQQIQYLLVYLGRTEEDFYEDSSGDLVPTRPSSCMLSSRWDFSDSGVSNKWSTPQQVYKLQKPYFPSGVGDSFDYGYNVIVTKNKVRGRGRAVKLYFDAEDGKDMHILGWAIVYNIEGVV